MAKGLAESPAGLDRVTLLPAGKAYAEAQIGASSESGWWARAEAGYRPIDAWSLFGWGQVDQSSGWSTGAGARWTF